MIFQHTLDTVLNGSKTQTSRIWKPNYRAELQPDGNIIVFSENTGRKLYYVGQEHAVQPGRGKNGVARIKVTALRKLDVRNFDHRDFLSEGFDGRYQFLHLWRDMHDTFTALVINFKRI